MARTPSPKELLLQSIRWRKVRDGHWVAQVGEVECMLRMNDFPEEPLYTVTVGGASMDVEDAPRGWTIE